MDKADFIAALRVAQDAGCQFVIGVPSLGGSSTAALTPEQAHRLPRQVEADDTRLEGIVIPF